MEMWWWWRKTIEMWWWCGGGGEKQYSQLSLRRTPSGPASAVRLREVSGL